MCIVYSIASIHASPPTLSEAASWFSREQLSQVVEDLPCPWLQWCLSYPTPAENKQDCRCQSLSFMIVSLLFLHMNILDTDLHLSGLTWQSLDCKAANLLRYCYHPDYGCLRMLFEGPPNRSTKPRASSALAADSRAGRAAWRASSASA